MAGMCSGSSAQVGTSAKSVAEFVLAINQDCGGLVLGHPLTEPGTQQFGIRLFLRSASTTDPIAVIRSKTEQEWSELLSSPTVSSFAPVAFFVVLSNNIPIPPHARKTLERLYAQNLKLYSLQARASVHVIDCLATEKVQTRLFKGIELAQRLYPWPEIRTSKDVDVVIAPDNASKACRTLQDAGWKLVQRLPIHDTFSKDGIILDVHTRFFGPCESALYCYFESDVDRFIRGEYSPEEHYVLLALKLFSETVLSPTKLLDLHILPRIAPLDAKTLAKVARRHNAEYALRSILSVLGAFGGGHEMVGHVRARPTVPLALSRHWPRLKYAMMLLHSPRLLFTVPRLFVEAVRKRRRDKSFGWNFMNQMRIFWGFPFAVRRV